MKSVLLGRNEESVLSISSHRTHSRKLDILLNITDACLFRKSVHMEANMIVKIAKTYDELCDIMEFLNYILSLEVTILNEFIAIELF